MIDHFKDHVAKLTSYGRDLETLEWKNPNSIHFAMWFVRQFGTVMVFGDLGEAIYQWYPGSNLEWVSTCGEDYFYGKCCASQHGRDATVFDSTVAAQEMKEYFAQHRKDEEDADLLRKEAAAFEEHSGWSSLEGKHEWTHWLRSFGDEVFGYDLWEHPVVSMGMVRAPSVRNHLAGLKAAFVYLKEKEANSGAA